MLTTDSDLRNN